MKLNNVPSKLLCNLHFNASKVSEQSKLTRCIEYKILVISTYVLSYSCMYAFIYMQVLTQDLKVVE